MLAKIFHNEAEIIEVYKGTYGIEKYTKQEFINKITMPLTSLKTLEVIDTQRQNGKIIKMILFQRVLKRIVEKEKSQKCLCSFSENMLEKKVYSNSTLW